MIAFEPDPENCSLLEASLVLNALDRRVLPERAALAEKAIDSDALSTTTFVLGVKKGLALINSLHGVDAIIIDERGLLHYSDGLLLGEPPDEAPATPNSR